MKYINTNKPVNLKTLIVSGEISDESRIQIFNNAGSLLACGRWYQDQILAYVDKIGTATKTGTGLSIKFKLS